MTRNVFDCVDRLTGLNRCKKDLCGQAAKFMEDILNMYCNSNSTVIEGDCDVSLRLLLEKLSDYFTVAESILLDC